MKDIIDIVTQIVKNDMEYDYSGHDFKHVERVVCTALKIAKEESLTKNVDMNTVHLGALLHDLYDHKKYNGDHSIAPVEIAKLLYKHGASDEYSKLVGRIVGEISWSSGKKPSCIESAIIQDADRLDATGAIGIVRCFVYNGNRAPIEGAIQHFDDKIKHIYKRMNTDYGIKLAKERHQFIETFLNQYTIDTTL